MGDKKVFTSSSKKVWLVSSVIFVVICVVFTFARGFFDFGGLVFGIIFGFLFALFPLFYGLGQKVVVADGKIVYIPNFLALITGAYSKVLFLKDVVEVRLGVPKYHPARSTLAAINIVSKDAEITFNPDLFDDSTLKGLFVEMKSTNPEIKYDKYALLIMENGRAGMTFAKSALSSLLWITLLIVLVGLVLFVLQKIGIASRETFLVLFGLLIILVPIIFNLLSKVFSGGKH